MASIGPRQVADPLPVNAASPALGHEGLGVAGLKRQLQNARDALVVLEIPHMDAAAEIEILGPESEGCRGDRQRGVRFRSHDRE